MALLVTISLSGELSKRSTLSGHVFLDNKVGGEISIPKGVDAETFDGPYEVTPDFTTQTLNTNKKLMTSDVDILPIQTYEVSNEAGGLTFII